MRRLLNGLCITAVACACAPRGSTVQDPDELRTSTPAVIDAAELFKGLDPPTVGESGPPRLVLRDGPPVPTTEHDELVFPPPRAASTQAPTKGEAEPLRVLSTHPRGAAKVIGSVRVTFSQPMVPLARLAEIRSVEPPLKMTPEVAGRFRWLGTTTLAFEPDEVRLPMATEFEARVLANTRSIIGGVLEEDVRFEFDTPRPEVVRSVPYSGERNIDLEPIIALYFNQRVDPADIASAAKLLGGRSVELIPVPEEEMADVAQRLPVINRWEDDRRVLLRPSEPLLKARQYQLVLRPGLVGSEGPRPMKGRKTIRFKTFHPLAVRDVRCGYQCRPSSSIYVEFNNLLESSEEELEGHISIEPEVEGFEFEHQLTSNRYGVTLKGDFRPRSIYRITIKAGVRDRHDQELARDTTRQVRFGDAYSDLSLSSDSVMTLESSSPRFIPVEVINRRSISLRAASIPRDLLAKAIASSRRGYDPSEDIFRSATLNAKTLAVATRSKRNERERVGLPLEAVIPADRPGYALVEIRESRWNRPTFIVQATDLGVVASVDSFGGIVRVTSLSTGQPVVGAQVLASLARQGPMFAEATTNGSGVARLAKGSDQPVRVVVRHGEDEAFVMLGQGRTPPQITGAIFTDRGIYRPGETAHLRVLARGLDEDPALSVQPLAQGDYFNCRVRDAHRVERDTFFEAPTPYGTLARDFEIPEGASTGRWQIYCTVGSSSSEIVGTFRVEEYRPAEIDVEVNETSGSHFHGEKTTFTVEGRYLFGAPASELDAEWTLGREPEHFEPPSHEGWLFGDVASYRWRPYSRIGFERRHGRHRAVERLDRSLRDVIARGEGALDNEGRLRVSVELEPGELEGPARFTLEAEVTDSSHQTVAARTSVVAHTASVVAGLRLERPFVRSTDPVKVRAQAVSLEGEPEAGRSLQLKLIERRSRLVARQVEGSWSFDWVHRDREAGRCDRTSAAEPVACRFDPNPPGAYVIEARATDAQGRVQVTKVPLYIHGRGFVPNASERLELVPDKVEYEVGERAKVLVRAPFAQGRGLLTVSRSGAISTRAIDLSGSVEVVEIPITDQLLPSAEACFSLVRGRASQDELTSMLEKAGPDALQAAANDIGRPTAASECVTLQVATTSKRLKVAVQPDEQVHRPREEVNINIKVADVAGQPVDAELAVMAVDEAVLSLLDEPTPDPVPALHRKVQSGVRSDTVHEHVVGRESIRKLRYRQVVTRVSAGEPNRAKGGEASLARGRRSSRGLMAGKASPRPRRRAANAGPVRLARRSVVVDMPDMAANDEIGIEAEGPAHLLRKLFATTAFYQAGLKTGADGEASVHFDLPDNLTTFRLMAVAVGRDDRSGSGESQVTTRKAVVLRPALPRFASYGDHFEAAVVVHNEASETSEILVGFRGAGLAIKGPTRQRITLDAGSSAEVSFPVEVLAGGGVARVQFAAIGRHGRDAVEIPLPLVEPATSEAFATYGSITEGEVRLPVSVPQDVLPRWGRLELMLSPTALTGLDDAATYLFDYRYHFAEPLSSRLVAAAALDEILEGRSPEARARVQTDAREAISKLLRLQHRYGGFKYWPESRYAELYTSAWATFALAEAQRAGFEIDDQVLSKSYRFLRQRLDYPRVSLGEDRAWSVQALALYTLAQSDQRLKGAHISRVWRHRRELPLFAKAWLLTALRHSNLGDRRVDQLWREIENASVETPAGAHFAENTVESARLLWHSERRTDAIVLATMLDHRAEHPLVEKTARGLLAARRDGHWNTTQENAWSLASLVRYFKQYERVEPHLAVQSWLGSSFVGETAFDGRQARVMSGAIPMTALQKLGSSDFVIARQGEGRLYYRLGLRSASADLTLPPEEEGFSVTRSYEPGDDDAVVERDGDGNHHVDAGSVVRVRVTVVVPDDRYDVAIDDPLPAGLESINTALSTTASQSLSGRLDDRRSDVRHYCSRFPFDHFELRDDRVVIYARRVPAGVYEVTYLARATTRGRFSASPAHVEEMYAPEVFGSSASDVIFVE